MPQAWLDFELQSPVWYDFEALQKRHDHVPVVLHSAFRPGLLLRLGRRFVERPAVLTTSTPALTELSLAVLSLQPPRRHGAQMWIHILPALHRPGSGQAGQCRSRQLPVLASLYLTADTMQWVTARKELQQYFERKERSAAGADSSLALPVLCYTGGVPVFTAHACRRADAWLTAIDCSIAQAWASYNFAGRFCETPSGLTVIGT